jgi:hypothetical protein
VAEFTTGIDWAGVKADLESQEWETVERDRQERSVFLGTVFRLYPSRKYYTPWANSNLEPCPACKGSGEVPLAKRRVWKKWHKRTAKNHEMVHKRRLVGNVAGLLTQGWYRAYQKIRQRLYAGSCRYCGGCGSREAYLDEQYGEALEAEAEAHGLFVFSGEGDPCDLLAGESRDIPWPEDEEDEDAES